MSDSGQHKLDLSDERVRGRRCIFRKIARLQIATLRPCRVPDARMCQQISGMREIGVLKKLGIKGRVLLLTLLPTSLMALVLGGYFTGRSRPTCTAN